MKNRLFKFSQKTIEKKVSAKVDQILENTSLLNNVVDKISPRKTIKMHNCIVFINKFFMSDGIIFGLISLFVFFNANLTAKLDMFNNISTFLLFFMVSFVYVLIKTDERYNRYYGK